MTAEDPKRRFACRVVEELRERGFEALWAGGCVRDQVLGRPPKDYDVATSALPEQIRSVFGRRRTIAIGAAFGVITVIGALGEGQIEVATFRQDMQYSDGRHPDAVVFTSAEFDAQRRDFTINGMFFDPVAGEIIDYVGGLRDLEAGTIRAIGDARQRFTEDKLRMLRAVRFAATFDFELEAATADAIRAMAAEVTVVSPERIAAELRAMLSLPRRARAMQLLADTRLLAVILPELTESSAGASPSRDASPADPKVPPVLSPAEWELLLQQLAAMPTGTFSVALAVLFHARGGTATAEHFAKRLKLSNKDRQQTAWLLATIDRLRGLLAEPWPQRQRLLVQPEIELLLDFGQAIDVSPTVLVYCRDQLRRPRAEFDPPPLITGDDLVAHGVRRGKVYVRLLDAVRDAQLDGIVSDKAESFALVDRLLAASGGK